MSHGIDLKNIEKRAALTYFQDGLWDLVLGVLLFAWGFGLLTDSAGFTAIWFTAAFWIVWAMKGLLTYPRVGQVKVALERQTLIGLLVIGLIALFFGTATYLVIASDASNNIIDEYFMLIFGAIIALIVSVIAFFWRVNRWYIYSLSILVGVVSYQWMNFSLPWSFMIPGIGVLLWGTAKLAYFLKNHPKIEAN